MHRSLKRIYINNLGNVSIRLMNSSNKVQLLNSIFLYLFKKLWIPENYTDSWKTWKSWLIKHTPCDCFVSHFKKKGVTRQKDNLKEHIKQTPEYNLLYNFFSHFSSDISKTFLFYVTNYRNTSCVSVFWLQKLFNNLA